MALSCALCWAVAVILFRRVGPADPWGLNLFKNTLASVLLCLTLVAMGRGFDMDRSAEDWARLLGSALLGLTLGDTLFFAGLQRIGTSVAAVTDCTYSPIVLGLSVLVLGETVSPGLLIGAPLVVAGLVVVSWAPRVAARKLMAAQPEFVVMAGDILPVPTHDAPADVPATSPVVRDQAEAPPSDRVDRTGVALAVGGVVATALGAIVAKPALEHSDLVEATTVRLLFATATLVLWQTMKGQLGASLALFAPHPRWRWLVPGTVAGTYVSMLLWLGGFKYAPAGTAALLNQSATVFLLVLSATVGGEVVPLRRWVGAAIALSGTLAVLAGRL